MKEKFTAFFLYKLAFINEIKFYGESDMPDVISKYITPSNTGNEMVDTIINDMVMPTIHMFCEIPVYYEAGARRRDGSYKFSYSNWNSQFTPEVFLNGNDIQLTINQYDVNYKEGLIIPKFESTPGDNLICSYNFSWFTNESLKGFIERSLATVNYSGQGATTEYTTSDFPKGWYGISADLVIAMCMENLILSYTMWAGKLIFSISANQMYDGSDSIVSQLETIKHNCEDRAYKAIDNPQLRANYAIAYPTAKYYRAISIGNGVRLGPHGQTGYGKTRGIKYNKMIGMSGPDLDI